MGEIEFGKCEICGKEAPLERTYFYYPIHCECCGSKDKNGQKQHFEMVVHCEDCPAPMPKEIHPLLKSMHGEEHRANITNILPTEIRGQFIINDKIIKEKALRRGDFALFDNLRSQYDRLLQTREQVTAKTITDTMSKEDKEKCNRLLRKIPVLADIAESSAVDLLSLLKKYDGTVTLPMLEELRAFNHIARDLRSIIDRVGDESFAISFGDTCDRVNEKIESIFDEN